VHQVGNQLRSRVTFVRQDIAASVCHGHKMQICKLKFNQKNTGFKRLLFVDAEE